MRRHYRLEKGENARPHHGILQAKRFPPTAYPGRWPALVLLGYHVGKHAAEIRRLLLQHLLQSPRILHEFDPLGALRADVEAQLKNPQAGGGAMQVMLAASRWHVSIAIHSTELPAQTYGTGHCSWRLAYHLAAGPMGTANHYEMLWPIGTTKSQPSDGYGHAQQGRAHVTL